MRVIGWEPCEATWWLTIRQTIAKPWPRDAVLMDLRFWRGQEIATADRPKAERIERPGRPALAATWGWTEWQVRTVVKSESEWFKQ